MLNKYLQKQSGLPSTTLAWRKSGAGFTLVETLLAIALLSMAIIAPLTIASSGIAAATTGKDRLIAISLGRDAIEHIRSMRDRNRLQGVSSWLTGFSSCTGSLGCRIDSTKDDQGNEVKTISSLSEALLQYDETTGLYKYQPSWLPSKFTRNFVIQELVSGREVKITVTVSWNTLYTTKSIVLIDQLMNW